ncbi:798_t:CDS:2, partial [Ambispora leptoticha]
DLLQVEVAKLGQNETISTTSHSMPSQSHIMPMVGIESPSNSSLHHPHHHHHTDSDYRQSSSTSTTSPNRPSKIQSSTSPLAVLPEFGFPPYYSHNNNTNYLRIHPSPESGGQSGGGSALGSRVVGGGGGGGFGTESSLLNPPNVNDISPSMDHAMEHKRRKKG